MCPVAPITTTRRTPRAYGRRHRPRPSAGPAKAAAGQTDAFDPRCPVRRRRRNILVEHRQLFPHVLHPGCTPATLGHGPDDSAGSVTTVARRVDASARSRARPGSHRRWSRLPSVPSPHVTKPPAPVPLVLLSDLPSTPG